MEPRARAGRHKSNLNFGEDLRQVLVAYGAPTHPDVAPTTQHPDSERYLSTSTNPASTSAQRPSPYHTNQFPNPYTETLRVLDEILTDFIIETCHGAVRHASLAGRQKINAKDFEFVIRRDKHKMGRVQDLVRRNNALKKDRKIVDGNEGAQAGRIGEDVLGGLAAFAGEDSGTGKGRGRGRGRRRKRAEMEAALDGTAEREGEAGDGLVGEDDLDVDGEGDEDDEAGRPPKRARSDTG